MRVCQIAPEGVAARRSPRRFPLPEAAAALRYAEAGGITDKLVLIPNQP